LGAGKGVWVGWLASIVYTRNGAILCNNYLIYKELRVNLLEFPDSGEKLVTKLAPLSIVQELSFCTCRDTDERRLSKIPDQDHVTADATAHGKQLLAVARPTESEDSS
jgi:hypothetical protein